MATFCHSFFLKILMNLFNIPNIVLYSFLDMLLNVSEAIS